MRLKVNDDRLNWNEPVEVITFLPEEKELHYNECGKYGYLETNIHLSFYVKKFKEFITNVTVNEEGKLTSISAKIPVDEVILSRSPQR